MAVLTNLYPPLVDTYMPAFLIQDSSQQDIYTVTKSYSVLSYSAYNSYESAVDEYITNSSIDGVQELWDEYEAKLAALREMYPDPEDLPILVEKERQLKLEYDGYLKSLISGNPKATITENTFFAEKPAPITITGSVTTETANTIDNRFICRVYFMLSPYNSLSQIQNAQVTVRSQLNNSTVLHPDKYPTEIMLKPILIDENRKTEDKYYIEIRPEDLVNCNFVVDQFYKVQIRFTSSDTENPGIDLTDKDVIQVIDSWLSKNLDTFSEWSTVCLIRGISIPELTVQDFDMGSATDIYDTVINTQIIGQLTFADENETETLRSYRIKVFDENYSLVFDSDEQFANQFTDVNNFNYAIKYWFKVNNHYYATIYYTTQNLYSDKYDFEFNVIPAPAQDFDFSINTVLDEENGRVKVQIEKTSAAAQTYTGKLVIRRASNKDNFAIWNDMYVTNYDEAGTIKYEWSDYTVENGIWYLYGIQGIDSQMARTQMVMIPESLMLNFEHIFLTSGDKQLKIEFNPSLTSFKHTISEVRTDTIGSKYPFIRRNGNIDYVQFPLGGFISSAMDENGLFTSKLEVFGDYLDKYNEYNKEKDIPIWRDVIWEKGFRDKVSNFLYADDIKLFRSPTEGNYLIKLMDVNFQPNQTLGRRLWSFSSNAFEIDECNIDNFDKYHIITINDYDTTSGGGGDEPSTLTPIKRIVFIDDDGQFPDEGRANVLYVYRKQLFIWNTTENKYILISEPIWNYVDPSLDGLTGYNRVLYTDERNDLYTWNPKTQQYEKISVPVMEG